MSQVILRRTADATVSTEEALSLVGATVDGRVIHHSGDNLLVDIAAGELDALKSKLTGWVVSPQQERIAVPDTRRRIA
ncbi:hypothetical protein ASF04_14355 [Duganella sp. Leaf61]|uniref:hypothetical protein n=1 Tax=Duganella sp. Leaf61 TaxID=1736227 RepID=UPI0006F6A0F0|nr:hypothetical protein [Duganella sp. Leaf61]KQN69458.1 hypothetical protein ASF04_14355 [Duganella sp. Leaf61]